MLITPRIPRPVPAARNRRGSVDFVSDPLSCGYRLRGLNIVDVFAGECVGQFRKKSQKPFKSKGFNGGERGIRTPGSFPVNGFQDPTLTIPVNLRNFYRKESGFGDPCL